MLFLLGNNSPFLKYSLLFFDDNSGACYNFTDAFDSLIDAQIKDPKLKL